MTIRYISLIATPLIFLAASGPALAEGVDNIKCILASNVFAKSGKDEQMRKIAADAAFFYLGRMNRYSTAQLKALISHQKKTISTANVGAIMNACAKEMEESGRMFDSLANG